VGLLLRNFDLAPTEIQVGRVRRIIFKELWVQRIDYEPAILLVFDEARLTQHAEVVGNIDYFHLEQLCEFGYVFCTRSQAIDDTNAVRFGNRLEAICTGFRTLVVRHSSSHIILPLLCEIIQAQGARTPRS